MLRRLSLTRMWEPHYVPDQPDEPTLSEVQDVTAPVPAPQGMISITTREWHYIYNAGYHRSQLYHWPTDPLEQQDVSELAENQTLVEHLRATVLSIVERSLRPWRDTRYLLALTGPGFMPDVEALKSTPSPPGGPELLRAVGAPQSLFTQNPETSPSPEKANDGELLKSLPYSAP